MAKHQAVSKSNAEKKREKETKYLYFITRAYVVLILAFYPLYIGPGRYTSIVFDKALVYWILSISFLVIFFLFYLAHRLELRGPDAPQKWWKTMSAADWALLAFLFFVTLSCVFSPYRDTVFLGFKNRNDGWLTTFCLLACYFPISRWYKPRKTDFILFAAGSMILCVIGFLQLYNINPLNLDREGFSSGFRSTIGNIDFVGTYVCMTTIAFGALYTMAKGPLRFLYLTASIMNYAFAIIGDSDAGKLGILGAAVLLIPYWVSGRERFGRAMVLISSWGLTYVSHHWLVLNVVMPNWPEPGGRAWDASLSALPLKPIIAVSLLALAAGIILLLPKFKAWPKERTAALLGVGLILLTAAGGLLTIEIAGRDLPENNRIYQVREILHGRLQDNYGSNRIFVWRKSLEAFPRNPLLGTGSDTFSQALSKLMQRESREKYGVIFDKAHNDFLQILLCNGIFALLSYLAFALSLIIASVKKPFNDEVALMAFGAVLAYLIQSFFGLDTVIVTPIYWIMAAILRGRQRLD